MENFSVVRESLKVAPLRPYHIALAHCIMAAKPGSERLAMLNHAFCTKLSPGDRLACRVEIRACQAAKRGELLAEVA